MKASCTHCWSYSTMRANIGRHPTFSRENKWGHNTKECYQQPPWSQNSLKISYSGVFSECYFKQLCLTGRGKKIPVCVPHPDLHISRRTSLYSSDEAMMTGGGKIGEERAEGRREKEKREEGRKERKQQRRERKDEGTPSLLIPDWLWYMNIFIVFPPSPKARKHFPNLS